MPDFEKQASDLVARLAVLLTQRGWRLATAESCTGGWIAKSCTDIAGSSEWFERGFVTYSNAAKLQMLGVSDAALVAHGAVSEEIARQMAKGAKAYSQADITVAVTGIAGPGSDESDKPVGLVHFGWCVGDRPVDCGVEIFMGDRDRVRRQTVLHALQGLIERVDALN